MAEKLLGKTLEQLTEMVVGLGMRRFVGAQLADWIYKKRVGEIADFKNLSQGNQKLLEGVAQVGRYMPVEETVSVDGTCKYLFVTTGGNSVESVYIPSATSRTLCISSQAGCRMGCRFCMTARVGFQQHLTRTDILNQILSVPQAEELTNIVFMGMGEPMDNIDEVLGACNALTEPWGMAWSPTRITVSTIGVTDNLKRLLDESRVNIAVSLHTPFHEERLTLMPSEKKYPLQGTLDLLGQYDFTHQRRLSFEYILFDGVNDTQRHIDQLVRLLKPIRGCRVNLISFHQIPDSPLKGTPKPRIKEFNIALNQAGITTTTRNSRGEDILAACGMLAAKNKTIL